MLRNTTLAAINKALTGKTLHAADFTVRDDESTDSQTGTWINLIIKFRHNDHDIFCARIPIEGFGGSRGATLQIIPGSQTRNETKHVAVWDAIYDRITQWVADIEGELAELPSVREVALLREKIDQISAQIDGMGDAFANRFFTREEAAFVAERLDKLQRDFEEEVRRSTVDKSEQDAQIAALKAEIEAIKDRTTKLSVKGVLISLWSGLTRFAGSPAGQKVLSRGADAMIGHFLPPGQPPTPPGDHAG